MENTHTSILERNSILLRQKGIDLKNKKILITNFNNTIQENDFTLPSNCKGFGRIHHFRKNVINFFPKNPLPIAPAESFFGKDLGDIVKVQVFQNAICTWRCWYCFVDYSLLNANKNHSSFLSADDLINFYNSEEYKCPIIDLSGGQPDLVPEWSLWMTDKIKAKNMDKEVFIWSDDNLSNNFLWEYLSKNQLKRLANCRNYGRVGCFKGFDEESFSFNAKADSKYFSDQFKIMRRIVDTGFNIYGYITLTTPNDSNLYQKICDFLDQLQERVHPLFPLRTIPLQIFEFAPTKNRLNEERNRSILIQQEAVQHWNIEISKRFALEIRNKNITDHILN